MTPACQVTRVYTARKFPLGYCHRLQLAKEPKQPGGRAATRAYAVGWFWREPVCFDLAESSQLRRLQLRRTESFAQRPLKSRVSLFLPNSCFRYLFAINSACEYDFSKDNEIRNVM